MRYVYAVIASMGLLSLSACNADLDWSSVNAPVFGFRTLDSYAPQSGDAAGTAMAMDSQGSLYVAGQDVISSILWVVRKSSDGGKTWTVVDSSISGFAYSIAIDAYDNIFVGGVSGVAGNSYGTVRKSSDHGASWSTVDSFLDNGTTSGRGFGIKQLLVDPQGMVYAFGSDGGWIVRRSDDQGASWATIDSFHLSTGSGASANAAAMDSAGVIYVAGFANDTAGVSHWIVRKSISGSTWSIIDSYTPDALSFAYPNSLAVDPAGNVYVAGFAGPFQSGVFYPPSRWIVRKGLQSGASWVTIDDAGASSDQNGSMANSVVTDSSGGIYVGGGIDPGNNGGGTVWTIKASLDGGNTWTVIDSIENGVVNALFSDQKSIYATGNATDRSIGAYTWTTRVLKHP